VHPGPCSGSLWDLYGTNGSSNFHAQDGAVTCASLETGDEGRGTRDEGRGRPGTQPSEIKSINDRGDIESSRVHPLSASARARGFSFFFMAFKSVLYG